MTRRRFYSLVKFLLSSLLIPLSVVLAQGIPPLPTVNGVQAGTVEGAFQVTDEGAATYTVPLSLPPGVGGIIPKISLTYDSRSSDGPLGIGFNLSGIPAIVRCPAISSRDGFDDPVDLDGNDRYCFDGQTLLAVSGQYGSHGTTYKTEQESFATVTSYERSADAPLSFRVQQKDTLVYEFGVSAESRRYAPGTSIVLSWHLEKVTDLNGNYYKISYSQDTSTGELLPTRIDYTGNSVVGTLPMNSLRFTWGTSSGPTVIRYIDGNAYSNSALLQNIGLYVGESLARQYVLTYSQLDIPQRPHLTSLQECGATLSDCIPATTFSWGASTSGNNFSASTSLDDFGANLYSSKETNPIFTGDWNGDGRTDIARWNSGSLIFYVSLASGWTRYTELSLYIGNATNDFIKYPIITGDWNGDGRTDFGRGSQETFNFYISSTTDASFRFYSSISEFNTTYCPDVRESPIFVGDFNGDGLSDVGRPTISRGSKTTRIYSSTGSGFVPHETLSIDIYPQVTTNRGVVTISGALIVGDWNCDGKSDLARITSTQQSWSFSSEDGLWLPFTTNFNLQQYGIGDNVDVNPIIVGDWNGDGCSDWAQVGDPGIVMFESRGVHVVNWQPSGKSFEGPFISPIFGLNRGLSSHNAYPIVSGDYNKDGFADIARVEGNDVGFYLMRGRSAYFNTEIPDLSPAHGYSTDSRYPFITGDWNGDGFIDIGRVGNSGINFYLQNYYEVQALRSIKNGFGAETTIQYGLLTDESIYETATGQRRAPVRVVTSIEYDNGIGTRNQNRYKYYAFKEDSSGRLGGGFEKVEVVDVRAQVSNTTWYKQDHPFSGRAYKTEKKTLSGIVLNRRTDTLESKSLAYGGMFIWKSRSVEDITDLTGALIDQITTDISYDDYGSPTRVAIVHLDGNSEVTLNEYINDPSQNILGRLAKTAITRSALNQPNITRVVSYEYLSARNLLLREIIEPDNATLRFIKRYEYDSFGNIVVSAISNDSINERKETYTYSSNGQFPVRVQNALGHIEQKEFDLRHGSITKVISSNNQISKFSYDAFGRISLEEAVDGTQKRTLYLLSSSASLPNSSYLIRVDESGVSPIITYYDKTGGEIRRETTGFAGEKINIDTVRDERGQVTHLSLPYKSGSAPLWNIYEYDQLGRQTYSVAPGNRVTKTEYVGLVVAVTDPKGNKVSRVLDSRGLVRSATDPAGTITYSYDSFGNLIQLTDQSGNKTIMVYDARGNRISIQDPSTGLTQFAYNGYGEQIRETRADGSINSSEYDLLGRLVKRTTSQGVERWTYDVGSYAKGKLSSMVGLNGYQAVYTYDQFGRIIQERNVIAARTFISTTSYDSLGRINTYKYPSNFSITHRYNTYGYLFSIVNTAANTALWTANSVDQDGRVTQETLGNGIVSRNTFDKNTGVLTNVKASTFYDMSFAFDSVGNLTSRRDNIQSISESFNYDTSNRLIKSQVSLQSPVTVSYNNLGNITSKSDVGTYTYGGTGVGPHAVVSIAGVKGNTYRYNKLGQRISSLQDTISYAWFGAPTTIKTSATQTNFQYSPDNSRVAQFIYTKDTLGVYNVLQERKLYVGANYEEITKGTLINQVHYLKGANGVFAIYTVPSVGTATYSYLHKDHQGSVQAISNQTGALVERLSFDAWGLKRRSDWTPTTSKISSLIDRSYTGHEYLEENSLVHMNGRVYDPVNGRFLSPDLFVQAMYHSQSLNRYSYVMNNPLSYVDPSGFFFKKLFKSIAKVFKKILPIAVAVAVSYYGGPFFASQFGVASSAGAAKVVATVASNAVTSFSASFAGSLVSGRGVDTAFSSGLRAGMLGGITGGIDSRLDEIFPSWNESITDVINNNGNLSVYRIEGAVGAQVVKMSLSAVAHGGVVAAFGGDFRKVIKESLMTSGARWALDYYGEQEFKAEWREAWKKAALEGTDLVKHLESDGFVGFKDLLRNMGTSLRTASGIGSKLGYKNPYMLGIINPFVNNVGIPGSKSFFSGEAGGFLSFVGQYVPGIQSVSISHDFLAVSAERYFGQSSIAATLASKTTIPHAVYGVTWAAGYRDVRNQMLWSSR